MPQNPAKATPEIPPCGHLGCKNLGTVPMNGTAKVRCHDHRDEAFDHNARSR